MNRRQVSILFTGILVLGTILWLLLNLPRLVREVLLPMTLGLVRLYRVIDSIPQSYFWAIPVIFALFMLLFSFEMPSTPTSGKISARRGRRIDELDTLCSNYISGKKGGYEDLQLYLVNHYLKSIDQKEIRAYELEYTRQEDSLVPELWLPLSRARGKAGRARRHSALIRSIEYLGQQESIDERR